MLYKAVFVDSAIITGIAFIIIIVIMFFVRFTARTLRKSNINVSVLWAIAFIISLDKTTWESNHIIGYNPLVPISNSLQPGGSS